MLRRRVSRRLFLQGAAAGSSLLLWPRLARRAGAAGNMPAEGFLTADEYRAVEALTARIVSSDDGTPGARECGVADYVQGLLSAFPGADANADGRVSAADLTAVALASGRILLTEDKDFGQLVYANGQASRGVILIRFPSQARSQLGPTVVAAVEQAGERLFGSFVVIQPGRVRISQHPGV